MRLIDADALLEELSTLNMTVIGLRAAKGVLFEFMKEYRNSVLKVVDEQSTIDPESLRKKGEWKNGVCTNCQFDLRCLTDGESDLEQWVWDEGFDFCPNCGADMRGNKNEC